MALIYKLLFYLSLFLSLTLFVVGFFRPISLDYDLGRHLLFGRIMLETHHIINTNLLSYTNTNFPYINSHWLSEVIFYIFDKYVELNGLIIFSTFISLLTLFILSKFILKRTALSAYVFSLPLFVSVWILRSDARPEIFSYLFIAIFIVTLFKFREKYTNLIFILIPLEAFWVNLHINFAVGPVLIFLFLVEKLILNKAKLNKQNKTLFIVLILSSLTTLLNPNFIKGALYPLFFFKNYGIDISENLSLFQLGNDYGYYSLSVYLLFFLSSFLLLIFYRKKTYLVEWFLMIIFSFGAVLAVRNFHILLYVYFYTYIRLFGLFLKDVVRVLGKYVSKNQITILKALCCFFLCLIIIVRMLSTLFLGGVGFGKIERGDRALNFFETQNLHGPIYNSFDLGQYISYRLYPREKVFVDGRPEAYPSTFLKDIYIPSQKDIKFFSKIDERYNFNTVLIYNDTESQSSLLPSLLKIDKYKMVYIDSYATIFLKNNSVNKNLIDKNSVKENDFHLQGNEGQKALISYIFLFDKIGWIKEEKDAYNYLRRTDPSGCFLKKALLVNGGNNQKLKNIKNLPTPTCY